MRKPFAQTRTAVMLICVALIVCSTVLWKQFYSETEDTPDNIPTEPDLATLFNADKLEYGIYEYSWETGFSPKDMQQLVDRGFLDEIPINPYTKKPMKAIRIGDFPAMVTIPIFLHT